MDFFEAMAWRVAGSGRDDANVSSIEAVDAASFVFVLFVMFMLLGFVEELMVVYE